MKIKHLSISGFRGFTSTTELDLDASVVLLVGKNGCGKTSLLDAILWCLTGRLFRLDKGADVVVAKYGGGSGETRVALVLVRDDGTTFTVTRRFEGSMHVTVVGDGIAESRGAAAEAELLRALGRDSSADAATDNLHEVLTRGIYLQQDRLRAFVESDNDQERFGVISDILGVGQVAELQRQLESSKNAWSRSTTALTKEQAPLQQRRDQLASRLNGLSASMSDDANALLSSWTAWRELANVFLVAHLPESVPADASNVIDTALKELHARQLQSERRIALVQRLLTHVERQPPVSELPTEVPIERRHLEQTLAEQRDQLVVLQNAAVTERARLVAATDQAEQLRALAQLALRHMTERCPVCDQEHDVESTQTRLERLLTEPQQFEPAAQAPLVQLNASIVSNERRLNELNALVHSVERSAAAHREWANERAQLQDQLDLLRTDDVVPAARAHLEALQREIVDLASLRQRANQLALAAARAGELVRRDEIQRALTSAESNLSEAADVIRRREQTGERAAELINALRASAEELVASELKEIDPILQRIYATVDPHPSFRAVQFLTKTANRRGRVWATVTDDVEDVTVDEPSTVLSSSQLNVLAVSVFLALNLSIDNLPLNLIALDDPLQSLDDINLLGLVDLLRRVRDRRQVIVTTHDARLGKLLAKKLRPVSPEHRTLVIYLDSWDRSGPAVRTIDLPRDENPLRLVAG